MKLFCKGLSILFLFLFLYGTPSFATPINCGGQGQGGHRLCEEREKVIEHEEVFNEKIITYKLEEIEQTSGQPSTTTGTNESPAEAQAGIPMPAQPGQANRSSDSSTKKNRPPRASSTTDSGHYLTCVTQQNYDNISKIITAGRIGSTGNEYHDKLIRTGQVKPNSEGIWLGDRVALVCGAHVDQTAGSQGNGAGQNSGRTNNSPSNNVANTADELQDLLASPEESSSSRLVPVESIRSWTETWYETVVEQFCWWVPDDAIIDPVTLEPIGEDQTADNSDSSQAPVPEPATMLLFGSIMAFFPVVRKHLKK